MTRRIRSGAIAPRALITALLLCLGAGRAMAQAAPSWLRYPAISPDGKTIAFVFKGDIYTVEATGGTARALTASETASRLTPRPRAKAGRNG